jgi:hypothetical protein
MVYPNWDRKVFDPDLERQIESRARTAIATPGGMYLAKLVHEIMDCSPELQRYYALHLWKLFQQKGVGKVEHEVANVVRHDPDEQGTTRQGGDTTRAVPGGRVEG